MAAVRNTCISAVTPADPLMDGSMPEIIVDNSDTTAVTFYGLWTKTPDSKRAYGPAATGPVADATLFLPL